MATDQNGAKKKGKVRSTLEMMVKTDQEEEKDGGFGSEGKVTGERKASVRKEKKLKRLANYRGERGVEVS